MPANLSKRSVVKHRTRKPFHSVHGKKAGRGGEGGTGANSTSLGTSTSASKGKGRSGFQVGPKHAPDGAYLGRAKKIKADLIEKAKIKKHFFKSVKGKEGQDGGQVDIDPAAIFNRDEGKFAPERKEEEGDEGSNILYQMRNREEVALQKEEKKGRGKDDRQSQKAQPVKGATKSSLRQGDAKHDEVVMSKEERQALRDKKTERWHSQSGSQRGRERGQPNLGARMDLLLERIKQQS